MPSPGNDAASSARAVTAALGRGLRRRRLRERTRHVWQAAPVIAAAALGTAVLARWTGWPAWVSLAVLLAGAVALAAWVALALRTHSISDDLASAIDAEAGLGGELRSASWFAARARRDAWADEHILRAAGTMAAVNWRQVYPRVRAGRPALTTAALTAAAIAVATILPAPAAGPSAAPAAPGHGPRDGRAAIALTAPLPPELLRQLQQLLTASDLGDRAAVQALSADKSLHDMLTALAGANDPQLLEALARALAEGSASDQQAADAMDALAERARRAAEAAGMSATMQDALEQLADELEIARPEPVAGSGASEAAGADASPDGGSAGGVEQMTIQFAEAATTDGSAGVMVLSNAGSADEGGGAPGAGIGGAASGDIAPGTMTDLEAALGREVVAAHDDAPGASVDAERHRHTEQGRAEAAFTRGAAASFGATPAATPPPVPEARRSDIRTYFARPPQ